MPHGVGDELMKGTEDGMDAKGAWDLLLFYK